MAKFGLEETDQDSAQEILTAQLNAALADPTMAQEMLAAQLNAALADPHSSAFDSAVSSAFDRWDRFDSAVSSAIEPGAASLATAVLSDPYSSAFDHLDRLEDLVEGRLSAHHDARLDLVEGRLSAHHDARFDGLLGGLSGVGAGASCWAGADGLEASGSLQPAASGGVALTTALYGQLPLEG